MGVIPDLHATARCRHDDGFDTGFDVRPPGIDVPPHVFFGRFMVIEMEAHGAAAAGFGFFKQVDTQPVENPCRRRIDVGGQRRLNATGQDQHATHVAGRLRPRLAGRLGGRQLVSQAGWQQGTDGAAQGNCRAKQRRARQDRFEQAAGQ